MEDTTCRLTHLFEVQLLIRRVDAASAKIVLHFTGWKAIFLYFIVSEPWPQKLGPMKISASDEV